MADGDQRERKELSEMFCRELPATFVMRDVGSQFNAGCVWQLKLFFEVISSESNDLFLYVFVQKTRDS